MGNKAGTTDFKGGSLLVRLDHLHYMSGQVVSGHVSYNLETAFPASRIILEIKGTERLIWDGHDPRANSKKHPGKIYLKTIFYRMEYVIHQFPEG